MSEQEQSQSPPPSQSPPQPVSIKDILNSLASQPIDDTTNLEEQGDMLSQKALFLLGVADSLENETNNNNNNNNDDGDGSDDKKLLLQQQQTPEQLLEKEKTLELISLLKSDAKTLMSYGLILKSNAKEQIETDTETLNKIAQLKTKLSHYDQYTDKLVLRTKNLITNTLSSDECEKLLTTGKTILQKLINQRQQIISKMIDGHEDTLALIDEQLGDLLSQKGNLIELISDLRIDAVLFLNHLDVHKETILKAAHDIENVLDEKDENGQSLKDDDDLQYLITKIKSKVTNKLSNDNDNDELASDITTNAEKIFDTIEDNDLVKKALQRGTALLETQGDTFDAEKLFDGSGNIDEFLKLVKNEALGFLLEYLPTVKIPPLEHDDENCTYSLHNIDLSKFHLLSENVDVELIDNGVFISATQISCEMDNLAFKYKSKSFPYPGASGIAYAKATGVSIALELSLEISDLPPSTTTQSNSTTPMLESMESNEQPQQEPTLLTLSSPKDIEPTSPSTTTSTTISTSSQQPSSPTTSSSSTTSTTLSTTNQDGSTIKKEKGHVSQRLLNKINSKLDHQYKLVLFHHPSHGLIKINELQMELKDFFLKSLANFLLGLFKVQIRDYITKTINNVILQQSEKLLLSINSKVAKYLPIIAKILKKVENRAPTIEKIVVDAAKTIKNDIKQDRLRSSSNVSTSSLQNDLHGDKTIQQQPNVKLDVPIEQLGLKNTVNEEKDE